MFELFPVTLECFPEVTCQLHVSYMSVTCRLHLFPKSCSRSRSCSRTCSRCVTNVPFTEVHPPVYTGGGRGVTTPLTSGGFHFVEPQDPKKMRARARRGLRMSSAAHSRARPPCRSCAPSATSPTRPRRRVLHDSRWLSGSPRLRLYDDAHEVVAWRRSPA